VGVDWDTSFARKIPPKRPWALVTVAKVSSTVFRELTDGSGPQQADPVALKQYMELEDAIARRGQVILYGPPGTGKTYAARRAATWLLKGGSSSSEAMALLSDHSALEAAELSSSSLGTPSGQVWWMVSNPKQWSWDELFKQGTVQYSLGRLKRNFPLARAGDLVVGYAANPVKRVVALARVVGEFDPDEPPEQALTLEPVTPVSDGLTYAELTADPVLKSSEPARFNCQGTLFALSPVESDHLLRLLAASDPNVKQVVAPSIQQLTQVTFHPSYTYEDFVEGFRPQATGSGSLDLRLVDGLFKRVCKAAAADPDRPYIVMIDEINRGNIPKIFGELITLLEKDKRGKLSVVLAQSGERFTVPTNLMVIGTMNTADRSIQLLDTALRRRFAFVEVLPEPEVLEGATAGELQLDLFLRGLNEALIEQDRERQIGHAVFFVDGNVVGTPEEFASIFRHEILPLLQEYLFDDYVQLAELLGEHIIDKKAQRPSALLDDAEALCSELASRFGASASS
jgi:5-methylcytosine-specific restriction protein B